jgi:hypothetical protein
MSTRIETTPARAGSNLSVAAPADDVDRRRGRALKVTAAVTIGSVALLVDLLLVGHTKGGEIWGLLTAVSASISGVLSLLYLARRGHNRAARLTLIGLWAMVAFFGFGGYNDHRAPVRAESVDARPRPPLAPLTFTAFGIAGGAALHYVTRKAKSPSAGPARRTAITTTATDTKPVA